MRGVAFSCFSLCRAADPLMARCFPKYSIYLQSSSFGTWLNSSDGVHSGHHGRTTSRHLLSRHPPGCLQNHLSTSTVIAQKDQSGAANSYSSGSSEKNGKNLKGPGGETASEVLREVDDRALPHFKEMETIAGTRNNPFPEPGSLIPKNIPQIGEETLPHPIWTAQQLEDVRIAHKKPSGVVDWMAYLSVHMCRFGFDLLSGYTFGTLNEKNWLRRLIYLENIAGVPGMMGAMVRHLKSLRTMKRDYGWIHTLLEEAENERMHLMVVLEMKQPGPLFRFGVTASQGVYVNIFFLLYLVSPRFCHRFVGYLEEEAVKTYTRLLEDIDAGKIPEWNNKPATGIAKRYWKLPDNATIRDMFAAIRADEAHHRLVNHTLSSMQQDQYNPFKAGH
ncbi:alternative oxidase, mitochondrial-like [Paramacrobiotus metropolitanus]|uniref:alternative oxidase, mitochondrial-like n=1 Tax=Paramacrobiotus metropolitanus TaxID=2943436 RepID=UPI002445A196|nr:alternative oxidase, mitochondrial-like [Paramacrobiotus metropolitanus]